MQDWYEVIESPKLITVYRHSDNEPDCLRDSYYILTASGQREYLVDCAIPIQYSKFTLEELEQRIIAKFGCVQWKLIDG
jgi:hypothetical protein